MRIDLHDDGTDAEHPRLRPLVELFDSDARLLQIALPTLPDHIPDWVTGVHIPAGASPDARAAVLDRIRRHRPLDELRLTFSASADASREIEQIATFTQLRHLWVKAPAACPAFEPDTRLDIHPLSDLRGLRSLHLFGPVRDIEPLTPLMELRSLEIFRDERSDFFHVYRKPLRDPLDVAPLAKLQLRQLGLDCVTDVPSLAAPSSLEELCLDGSDVVDLGPLRSFPRLRRLSIHFTHVADLSPLSELPELRELYVGRTMVSDIRALGACKNLERLALIGSNIPDIARLQACPRLEQLVLSDWYIDFLDSGELPQSLRLVSIGGTIYRLPRPPREPSTDRAWEEELWSLWPELAPSERSPEDVGAACSRLAP